MGKLKKLRKHSETLSHRVQILEQQQRITELRSAPESQALGFHTRGAHTTGAVSSKDLLALIEQVKKHNGLAPEEETTP